MTIQLYIQMTCDKCGAVDYQPAETKAKGISHFRQDGWSHNASTGQSTCDECKDSKQKQQCQHERESLSLTKIIGWQQIA